VPSRSTSDRLEAIGTPVPVLPHGRDPADRRGGVRHRPVTGRWRTSPVASRRRRHGPSCGSIAKDMKKRSGHPLAPMSLRDCHQMGTRVALDVRDQENDIWVWDFIAARRSHESRSIPGIDGAPAWTQMEAWCSVLNVLGERALCS
jgi:hypothetical protein